MGAHSRDGDGDKPPYYELRSTGALGYVHGYVLLVLTALQLYDLSTAVQLYLYLYRDARQTTEASNHLSFKL